MTRLKTGLWANFTNDLMDSPSSVSEKSQIQSTFADSAKILQSYTLLRANSNTKAYLTQARDQDNAV